MGGRKRGEGPESGSQRREYMHNAESGVVAPSEKAKKQSVILYFMTAVAQVTLRIPQTLTGRRPL
jgi:hypothetical protein